MRPSLKAITRLDQVEADISVKTEASVCWAAQSALGMLTRNTDKKEFQAKYCVTPLIQHLGVRGSQADLHEF